jgi:hypothetical protein
MLVYTNLFTLRGHNPSKNNYVTMFFIWFTYLKKYGGLEGTLGILTDTRTFDYINKSDFAKISESCNFKIEFSTYPPPATLMEGSAQRYKSPFALNKINLYLNLDCLVVKPFYTIFTESHDTLYLAPEESMEDNNHGGFFLEGCAEARNLPGFSSKWFAFTEGEEVAKFLNDVPKGVLANVDSPLYTLDQPFYNYELFLRLTGKKKSPKLCIMDSKIVSINPFKNDAFFVIFCGENLNKILAFMCIDFFTPQPRGEPLVQGPQEPQGQQPQEPHDRPGEASPAHQEEGHLHS